MSKGNKKSLRLSRSAHIWPVRKREKRVRKKVCTKTTPTSKATIASQEKPSENARQHWFNRRCHCSRRRNLWTSKTLVNTAFSGFTNGEKVRFDTTLTPNEFELNMATRNTLLRQGAFFCHYIHINLLGRVWEYISHSRPNLFVKFCRYKFVLYAYNNVALAALL